MLLLIVCVWTTPLVLAVSFVPRRELKNDMLTDDEEEEQNRPFSVLVQKNNSFRLSG